MKKELRIKLEKASWTCISCGLKYGEARGSCATFHNGRCDVCGEEKLVTETRDYGYFRKTLNK
jgi:hypothetical protein